LWITRPLEKLRIGLGERTDNVYFVVIMVDTSTTIVIDKYGDMEDVRRQIIKFAPEAVYYDRNVYNERGNVIGQKLVAQ